VLIFINSPYHSKVLLPNLLRLTAVKPGERVLDLASGNGFFARAWAAAGAHVTGADLSPELIAKAEAENSDQAITYLVAPAHRLPLADQSFDLVTLVLALQNIAEVKETLAEIKRVLARGGRFVLVLNHPSFRVPKHSSWEWDDSRKIQYRRVDEYLSERQHQIEMHPGLARRSDAKAAATTTISFHRPLQYYVKLLANAGFAVTRLEEWISHRQSQPGPRAKSEDRARHEFPLFLALEARIINL
jgi:ubiquinone/menaquinone biosynthesis C-methylase UbiE